MSGRPERPQTNVRLVRRGPPRTTRLHGLPSVAAIVVAVCVVASFAAATGSGAGLISTADPGSASPAAQLTSSVPPTASVAPAPSSSATTSVPHLPACRYADEPAAHAAYDDWQRTIVDTTSRLPKGYVPPDLVSVSRAGLSGGGLIRRIAIADLRALTRAARRAGVRFAVESAYRSEARQRSTFAGWVRTSGEAEARRFSARAGHSEHELGTAIDLRAVGGGTPWTPAFARSRHAIWLAGNAWMFGWIQSYPSGAEKQTCYGGEAWHYRYVGRDVAADVHASAMTLRAWLWLQARAREVDLERK
jgi:D-alanyl-D-alanine carboxypeptidase